MKYINQKIPLSAAMMLAMLLGSYLYSSSADAAEIRNISKINGDIRISADEQVGNISSVNGGIDLARDSRAEKIDTVNGGIDLDERVVISQAETINGGIRVGNDVTVSGSLLTVNGSIRTNPGTQVEQGIRTVNGKIQLTSTSVGADVQTNNGDIIISDGSSVAGDIIVKGRRSWWERIFRINRKPSDVSIDASSSVMGDIHLYREVTLNIEEGAEVGEVIRHYLN
jgi:DUF4097 and DUF4098 domain-containing protein YvlB